MLFRDTLPPAARAEWDAMREAGRRVAECRASLDAAQADYERLRRAPVPRA
jgi:hypothetical protein